MSPHLYDLVSVDDYLEAVADEVEHDDAHQRDRGHHGAPGLLAQARGDRFELLQTSVIKKILL